jgi:hypothetical protein
VDTSDGYELSWHEDDQLHQAEGMLSARLGITVDEARTPSTNEPKHRR